MKVEYIKADVLTMLKDTKLMGSDLKPYENAEINYRVDYANSYKPCQNYILMRQVHIISQIAIEARKQCGVRVSNLNDGYLVIDGKYAFTPPIIEKDNFLNGEYIINDGMHRMFYFMNYTDDPCRIIVVENATCPYYSYPTSWEKVQALNNEIPHDYVKKVHRIKEYKKLYRDFNTAFPLHVGAPRGKG